MSLPKDKIKTISFHLAESDYNYYKKVRDHCGFTNFAQVFGKWRKDLNGAGYYLVQEKEKDNE